MSPLTLYGAAAVTAMLIAYACEHRSKLVGAGLRAGLRCLVALRLARGDVAFRRGRGHLGAGGAAALAAGQAAPRGGFSHCPSGRIQATEGAAVSLPSLRERLAALEHEQWMAWTRHLAAAEQLSGRRVQRWQRSWVPYCQLSEASKDADRLWTDRILLVLDEYVQAVIGEDEPGGPDAQPRNEVRREQRRRHDLALRGR